jgi:hypothetical protein
MAIDVRQLGDVVVHHIGARERLTAAEVVEFLGTRVHWRTSEDRATLRLVATCPHPALQLALEEQAAHVAELLDYGHQMAHGAPDDVKALLGGLPRTISTDALEAAKDEQDRPRYETPLLTFRLAHDEIRDLLMGVRLYGDPALAIRELYQNALDACRYRNVRAQFADQQYSGRIVFRQGVDENGRAFVECEDNGVGMGSYELEHVFSRAGRRFVHTPEFLWERAKWRAQRPDLELWPNSRFGIGVFSYFMLADEIEIWTARADRGTGQAAAEELHVSISSSGALFRIQKAPTADRRRQGGTLIRLYLRTPESGAQPVSCIGTLRSLLRYSDFEVTCEEEGDREHWPADELHVPDEPDQAIVRGSKQVWFADEGALLADGLLTDRALAGIVVNLTGEQQPDLSVDRKRLEGWDRDWMRTAIRAAAERAPIADALDYLWLWRLADVHPEIGGDVWNALAERDTQLTLGWAGERAHTASVRELGAFGFDHIVAGDLSRYSRHIYDADLTFGDAERLLVTRARLLGESWPAVDIGDLAGPPPDVVSWQPRLEPLDGLLLQATDASARLMDKPGYATERVDERSLTGRVAHASASFGVSVQEVIAHCRMLIGFGIKVPADHVERDDLVADADDVELVEAVAHGGNDDLLVIASLAQFSQRHRVPWRTLIDRLDRYRATGLRLPPVDVERLAAFADHIPTAAEVTVLGELVGASSYRFHGESASALHWITLAHAANRDDAEQMSDEMLERLMQLARLDEDERAAVRRCLDDDADLIALSHDLGGDPLWLRGTVSLEHLEDAGKRLGEPPERVLERLRPYAALLGLRLPGSFDSERHRNDLRRRDEIGRLGWHERLLLSRSADADGPYLLDTVVPVRKLVVASGDLRESLEQMVERLQQLPAELGVTAPELPAACAAWAAGPIHETFFDDTTKGDYAQVEMPYPALQFSLTASKMRVPVGTVARAMSPLATLLPGLPQLEPHQLAELDTVLPAAEDELLLHWRAFRRAEPLAGTVDPLHILHAAVRLGWTLGRVCDRLAVYAPLGLELPDVPAGVWREAMPSWEDFTILTRALDGAEVLAPGPVGPEHIARAAAALRCEPERVRARLELYAELCQLELPA